MSVEINFNPKILPGNVEIEAALLGCLLNNGKMFSEIEGAGLTPEDFYDERNAVVFRAIKSVFESQKTPDIMLVIDQINNLQKDFKTPLDTAFIFELANNAPIIYEETLSEYCSIIIEKSLYREMIRVCSEAVDDSYRQDLAFDELADKTTSSLIALSNRKQVKSLRLFKDLLEEEINNLADRLKNGRKILGISSGYPILDNFCSGFKPGDMIVLAGRPAMGKTSFALNMALEIARNNYNVLFFTLEMPASQLVNRLISIECSVNAKNILNGSLEESEITRLWASVDKMSQLPIFIDETSSLTISDLRSKAKKLDAELRKTPNPKRKTPNRLDCIFVDYLQLMSTNIYKEDKVRQVEYISKNIKLFAKDLKIPIVALAQLNRKVEERENKIPMLSDLKDSGSIEQDADMVMFINRQDVYKKENERNNKAEIWIQKNRHGQQGVVHFHFVPQYTKFTLLTLNEDS